MCVSDTFVYIGLDRSGVDKRYVLALMHILPASNRSSSRLAFQSIERVLDQCLAVAREV